jgi:hypothetical protein
MALKGKQKELDKNKDGKISGEDFKMMKARKGKMASDRDRKQKEITEKQNPISEYDKKGKLKYTAAKSGKMMKAKKGRLAEEDQYSKYVREIKEDRKPKGMKRLSDEVKKKSMGGESRGYGAARTSGMGLQDEELIPGKSLDYYKDVM